MVLLQKLVNAQKSDPKLLSALKQMFSQALTYICKVDFNDINYKNIPFTVDGRLAPFDTDTGIA